MNEALAILEKALGPEHPDVATSLNNLGTLYQNMGEYAKAEPLLQDPAEGLGPRRSRA